MGSGDRGHSALGYSALGWGSGVLLLVLLVVLLLLFGALITLGRSALIPGVGAGGSGMGELVLCSARAPGGPWLEPGWG